VPDDHFPILTAFSKAGVFFRNRRVYYSQRELLTFFKKVQPDKIYAHPISSSQMACPDVHLQSGPRYSTSDGKLDVQPLSRPPPCGLPELVAFLATPALAWVAHAGLKVRWDAVRVTQGAVCIIQAVTTSVSMPANHHV
jgi:hypothetical protein